MSRALAGFAAVVVVAVVACAGRSESGPGLDGPPRPPLAAAPAEASPAPEAAPTPEVAAAAEAEAPRPVQRPAATCADGMVLVDGDYCTDVKETCLEWLEPPSNKLARCARYAPSACVGERVHKRFCIDRDEFVPPGQSLPLSDVSWTDASAVCGKEGKRLCLETEWEYACGGSDMLPYPTGYVRDDKLCNFDKPTLLDLKGNLLDLREPEDGRPGCVSPFGVHNMSGNVDEWVMRDRTYGTWRSALKGGWWMPARDRCRPATTAHDESFHQLQTGVRCCKDAPATQAPAPAPSSP